MAYQIVSLRILLKSESASSVVSFLLTVLSSRTIGSCLEVTFRCSSLPFVLITSDVAERDPMFDPSASLFSANSIGVIISFSVSSSFSLFVPGLDDFELLSGLA